MAKRNKKSVPSNTPWRYKCVVIQCLHGGAGRRKRRNAKPPRGKFLVTAMT